MNTFKKALSTLIFTGYIIGVHCQTGTVHSELSQTAMIDSAKIWFSNIKMNGMTLNMNPWPVDIYGKTMFVEPESRFLVANFQNKRHSFTEMDSLFVGRLDINHGIANTSKEIYGEMWTMVDINYLAGKSANEKNWIIAHESFHRIQNEIGLPAANPENAHLETKDGRIFLQLELRALQKALTSAGHRRIKAIEDALIFRNYRFEQFANAESEECRFEMHEGLAEYTGAKLSGYDKQKLGEVLAEKLKLAEQTKNFKWFFAYLTGPAYGLLLDEFYPQWIKNVSVQTNLAKLLQASAEIEIQGQLLNSVNELIEKYDGKSIIDKENSIYQTKLNTRKQYVEKFMDDTTLVIPLSGEMSISFDPMNAFELDEFGTIYPGKSHISDKWGVLETNEEFLLGRDWSFLKLPKPIWINKQVIKGDSWQLQLNEQWNMELVNGNYKIVKKAKETDQENR